MKRTIKLMLASVLLAAMMVPVLATTWYVSPDGKKKNEGTSPSKPLKAIWSAVEAAQPGDTILVAEGNYTGKASCGFIEINKPLEIYGGYSKDFSERNIAKYQTSIRPSIDMNATPPKNES